MSQNIGTLVSAAIRPNNSLDPIASAFASEIKGGLHTVQNISERNAIIVERREWGMMCYSIDDNLTYQLEYGLQDTNIMNNNNWTVFSGSGINIGVTVDGKFISGAQQTINVGEVLHIPLNFEYNVFTLNIDGTVIMDGDLNIIS